MITPPPTTRRAPPRHRRRDQDAPPRHRGLAHRDRRALTARCPPVTGARCSVPRCSSPTRDGGRQMPSRRRSSLRLRRPLCSDAGLQPRSAETQGVTIVTADAMPDCESRSADEIFRLLSEEFSRNVVTRALQHRAAAKGVRKQLNASVRRLHLDGFPRREPGAPTRRFCVPSWTPSDAATIPLARAVLNTWMELPPGLAPRHRRTPPAGAYARRNLLTRVSSPPGPPTSGSANGTP